MALDDETFERIGMILEQLGAVRGKITGKSLEFFDDQVNRYERWKHAMFISQKQMEWLENIYEKFVGPLDKLEGLSQDESKEKDDDIDDDIPY